GPGTRNNVVRGSRSAGAGDREPNLRANRPLLAAACSEVGEGAGSLKRKAGAIPIKPRRLGSDAKFLPDRFVEEDFLEEFMGYFVRGGLVGIGKQTDAESRPLAFAALGFDFAAVVMDDEVAGHEIDTVFHGAVAAHHEGIEDKAERFFGKAGAVVGNAQFDFGNCAGLHARG